MSKLNDVFFKVDKPKIWLNSHFNDMLDTIYHYIKRKRLKLKFKVYFCDFDNSYIVIYNDYLLYYSSRKKICDFLFVIYKDIKLKNDNLYLQNYIKKGLKL